MSDLIRQVQNLFTLPGAEPDGFGLMAAAEAAYQTLIRRVQSAGDAPAGGPIDVILAESENRSGAFRHPLLAEGLHELAPSCPALRDWHSAVAPIASSDCVERAAGGPTALDNIALALRLRRNPELEAQATLASDIFGRIRFPGTHWSVSLRTNGAEGSSVLAHQPVAVELSGARATWRLNHAKGPPLLSMSRENCLRMVIEDDEELDAGGVEFPNAEVRPRLQFARPIGQSPIRYDPVSFVDFEAHAGSTGSLIEMMLDAVRDDSPGIYRELCRYIHSILGLELPDRQPDVVESMSDPTRPCVMAINIPYTAGHEPCLSPFCFTWLGHELGHTKHYLIETVAAVRGGSFLRDPSGRTPVLPRYGRSLAVRTLFQIPYVHLYEWVLLMDFMENGFRGLAWDVPPEEAAVGDDLCAEIQEGFELIQQSVPLTPLGEAAVDRIQSLLEQASQRWSRLRGAMRQANISQVTH